MFRFLYLALGLCIWTASAHAVHADQIYVLARGADGPELRADPLPDGQTLVYPVGPDSPFIQPILPPGPGRSSGVVMADQGGSWIVRRRGETIDVSFQNQAGQRHGWEADLSQLREQTVRVSATLPDARAAFLIESYRAARRASGPVFNPFAVAGFPLPGQVVVETDTYTARHTDPDISGSVAMMAGPLPAVPVMIDGQPAGLAVIDLGAASSVFSSSVIPEGTDILRIETVSYSAAGRQVQRYAPEGASGTIETITGIAALGSIAIGSADFGAADIVVMPDLERVFDGMFAEPVVAIAGADLLSRAEQMTIATSPEGQTLSFGASEGEAGIPFTFAGGLYFVEASSGGTPIDLILDTGARASLILAPEDADAVGWVESSEDAIRARGLDGGVLDIRPGTMPELVLGSHRYDSPPVSLAAVAAFQTRRSSGRAIGLAGYEFLSARERVVFDFRAGQLVID